jgi:hypothetical protein
MHLLKGGPTPKNPVTLRGLRFAMKVRVTVEYDLPPGDRGTLLHREELRWASSLPELGLLSATIEVQLINEERLQPKEVPQSNLS